MELLKKIAITGGAGYVGSVLASKLLKNGYSVSVLDLLIYDSNSLEECKKYPNFKFIKGDIRNKSALRRIFADQDCVIHLAAISNDPTGELDADLTKSVNYDSYKLLLKIAKECGIKRFINVSSSSVYGINEKKDVIEEMPCNPVSLYGRYKLESEKLVNQAGDNNFTVVNVRPATICGYSPRQRFDLTVNVLTKDAVTKGVITVNGGEQRRPHVTMQDVTDIYIRLINEKKELIANETFNIGFENMKIIDTANLVKEVLVPQKIEIVKIDSYDSRDYHISSEKIKTRLNFQPKYTIKDAILELQFAFTQGLFGSPEDDKYYNIKKMKIKYFK